MSNDIVFDDPSELGQLLESSKAPSVEIDHQEVVAQVQKNAKAKSAGKPQGESLQQHPGAVPLPHQSRENQKFAVNGQMLSKKEYDALFQAQDPNLYNFLLKAQRSPEIIDPAGPIPVGADPRYPIESELEAAVGHICSHCLREIEEEECSWKDVGTLVYYGKNEAGEPLIWHYGCWMTQILLWAKGNAEKACEKFGGTILELLVWRRESGYNWQRLGMVRGD